MSRTITSSSYPSSLGNVVGSNAAGVSMLLEGPRDPHRRLLQVLARRVAAERDEQVAHRSRCGFSVDLAHAANASNTVKR